MTGWLWIIIGIALCTVELLVASGFFLFLLGVSGIILGTLVLAGLFQAWPIQAAVYAVIAVICWLLFGNRLKKILAVSNEQAYDTKGKTIKVTGRIEPGQVGSGELWGSAWRLKNVGTVPIDAGSECIIVDAEGVTLHVTHHS